MGHTTTYEYDDYGYLARQTDPNGHVTRFIHNLLGTRIQETTTRTRGDGSTEILVTHYGYDRQQRPTSAVGPDGNATRIQYDALGQVSATVDPLGRRTTFIYDDLGRQIRTTYPDGLYEAKAYDAENRLLESKDRSGRISRFTYDPTGRLLTTTHPDGAVTQNFYDPAGRLTKTVDARNQETHYQYDEAGRLRKTVDALEFEFEFGYDDAGNQTTVKDARGYTTTFVYDTLNRHIRTVFPDLSEIAIDYDELGRRIAEKDQAGKVTRFGYDALGRLISVTDALDQVTRYGYDEVGNRVAQTDANLHVTRFEFDAAGRQVKRILPDGAFETATYDLAGNQKSRTDFKGVTTVYEHDNQNRLTRRLYPGGEQVGFTYTPTGRRKTAVDARGTTSYEYDDRDRLKTLIYPDGRQLRYSYDANGNRSALTAAVGTSALTTAYSYDELDRLAIVTDPEGGISTQTYDPNGNRATLQHSNGVITTYDYDPLNRLEAINAVNAEGATVTSFSYTLGPGGNRTKIVEFDGTTKTYAYDDLYRLTSEKVTLAGDVRWSNTFTYDPVGNRQAQNRVEIGGGARSVAYSYDTRDRLLTENQVSYGWDANGNQVGKSDAQGAQYEWDFENRLTKVILANGTKVEHTYDVDGARVRTVTTPVGGPPQVVEYLVDTSGELSQVVLEASSTTSVDAYFVRGDDLIATIRPEAGRASEFRSYHADGLGSIRALADDLASVTDRWQFEAFGELKVHSGSDAGQYLFAGEMLNWESGLYYNRARWMNPKTGLFASSDAFAGTSSDPASLHKYLYAGANPTRFVDPSGYSLMEHNVAQAIRATLFVLNVHSLVSNTGSAIGASLKVLHAVREGRLWDAVAYASIAVLHSGLAALSLVGISGGISPPPSALGALGATLAAGGKSQVVVFWQIAKANPKLGEWVLSQVIPVVGTAWVMFATNISSGAGGQGGGTSGLSRPRPQIEDGNENGGWKHIESRHISGTDTSSGVGDLFPKGTTREQLQELAELLVRTGNRTSRPGYPVQVFQRRTTFNGQHANYKIIVHKDGYVISMFPMLGGS